MDEEQPSGPEIGAGCLLMLISMVAGMFMSGWAIGKLWGWFIVPLGVPTISFWHGLGLACAVSLFTHRTDFSGNKNKSWWSIVGESLARAFIIPTVFVAFGWFYHHMMGS